MLDTPGILQPAFEGDDQAMALAAIGSIKLDILPLDKVSNLLINRLNELGVDTTYDSEADLYNQMKDSKKTENEFYKRIIKKYQQGKITNRVLDKK
jgi:ribosome biogenesis GTPase A